MDKTIINFIKVSVLSPPDLSASRCKHVRLACWIFKYYNNCCREASFLAPTGNSDNSTTEMVKQSRGQINSIWQKKIAMTMLCYFLKKKVQGNLIGDDIINYLRNMYIIECRRDNSLNSLKSRKKSIFTRISKENRRII